LPDPRAPRRPGYLDRLLETGPTGRPGAVRAPHQIRWAPAAAPGADADAEPEPGDGAADRPYAKPAATPTESGVAGPIPAIRHRYPPALGVPPQRRPGDTPTNSSAAADRDAGGTWLGVPTAAATGALAQLKAASLRLDPPGPAEGGPGSHASKAIRAQAGAPQATPVTTRESRRTQPQHAPSVHIGSVEVRLTAPQAPPATPPPRSPMPAVTRLSRPQTPFGLGQV
jgi:hypothetical protein